MTGKEAKRAIEERREVELRVGGRRYRGRLHYSNFWDDMHLIFNGQDQRGEEMTYGIREQSDFAKLFFPKG